MEVIRSSILSAFLMAVVAVFFLAGGAAAAEAPAPTPTSTAGAVAPPLTIAALASFIALLFGSLRH